MSANGRPRKRACLNFTSGLGEITHDIDMNGYNICSTGNLDVCSTNNHQSAIRIVENGGTDSRVQLLSQAGTGQDSILLHNDLGGNYHKVVDTSKNHTFDIGGVVKHTITNTEQQSTVPLDMQSNAILDPSSVQSSSAMEVKTTGNGTLTIQAASQLDIISTDNAYNSININASYPSLGSVLIQANTNGALRVGQSTVDLALPISMGTNKITNLAAPTSSSNDAARAVDLDSYLPLTGGTLSGDLSFSSSANVESGGTLTLQGSTGNVVLSATSVVSGQGRVIVNATDAMIVSDIRSAGDFVVNDTAPLNIEANASTLTLEGKDVTLDATDQITLKQNTTTVATVDTTDGYKSAYDLELTGSSAKIYGPTGTGTLYLTGKGTGDIGIDNPNINSIINFLVGGAEILRVAYADVTVAVPHFSAKRAYGQFIPDATDEAIAWDPLDIQGNRGFTHSTTKPEIVIPSDGLYNITYSIAFVNNSAGRRIAYLVTTNTTDYDTNQRFAYTEIESFTGTPSLTGSVVLNCYANDEITLYVYQTTGGILSTHYGTLYGPEITVTKVGMRV